MAGELPQVLRKPPWLSKAGPPALPVLAVKTLVRPGKIEWSPEELAEARRFEFLDVWKDVSDQDVYRKYLGLTEDTMKRVIAGNLGTIEVEPGTSSCIDLVFRVPGKIRLAFWNNYPGECWMPSGDNMPVQALIATHGVKAIPGLRRLIAASPYETIPLAPGIDSQLLVEQMLHVLRSMKHLRPVAVDWVRAYPETVARQALPLAFGDGPEPVRDDARNGLRWLADNGMREAVDAVAQAYGAAMADAVALLLAPESHVAPAGSSIPTLPRFFLPAAWHRPQLANGSPLPDRALAHLGTMLAMSGLDSPYPALAAVRQACTSESLAVFAWDLCNAWATARTPPQETWALTALGLLGDDEGARRLAPLIRQWAGASAPKRAALGLDVLAAIGTDVALMQLNDIAGGADSAALRKHAKEKMAAVADARGLTAEELADRLVPDLGLAADGTATLDFGRRQFRVCVDDGLQLFVRDPQGARLKDLPAPAKADDAALAEAASERYRRMKKEARSIATLQLRRLELAMATRRRWTASEFRLLFLQHPLMRQLAARLLWGVYRKDKLTACLRVAEDWTLADAEDELHALPDDAVVGIAHVAEMPTRMLEVFTRVFDDYRIQQPFAQLARQVLALTAPERKSTSLKRFRARNVTAASLMGLVQRGWERGPVEQGGHIGVFRKPLPGGLLVELGLTPGLQPDIGMAMQRSQQPFSVTLRRDGTEGPKGLVLFGELDAVAASEVLRDLELLEPAKE